jgi:hypothetical protein
MSTTTTSRSSSVHLARQPQSPFPLQMSLCILWCSASTSRTLAGISQPSRKGPYDSRSFNVWCSLIVPAHNPATCPRIFGHLYGKDLERALRQLPDWEELHELRFWHNSLDVLILYLIDTEGRSISSTTSSDPEEYPLVRETVTQGFKFTLDRLNHHRPNPFRARAIVIRSNLANHFSVLQKSPKPQLADELEGVLPAGYQVIQMPGHVGEQFMVRDHYFTAPVPRQGKKFIKDNMCMVTRLQLPYGFNTIRKFLSIWWARLRLLDASLLPWVPGQKINDVNPPIDNVDHPIRKC